MKSQFLLLPLVAFGATALLEAQASTVDNSRLVLTVAFNYVAAYQMLHRSAKVRPGQRVAVTSKYWISIWNICRTIRNSQKSTVY